MIWASADLDLMWKMANFQQLSYLWNRYIFCPIMDMKRRCLARLSGIQGRQCQSSSRYLESLEEELRGELNLILLQEEML